VQAGYSGNGNLDRSVSVPTLTPLEQSSPVTTTTTTTAPPTTTTTVTPQSGGMSAPPGYTSQQLIFDDQFKGTTLDTSKWTAGMAGQGSPGWWSGYDWGAGNHFTATGTTTHQTFFDPARVVVNNGLSITMSYDPTYAAGGWTTRSGCISTYNKFTFTSGYVQVRAEMPDSSSGQWPAIWLLPNGAPNGGGTGAEEIDMEEGGFLPDETGMPSNTPVNNNFAPNYHNPNGTDTISPAGAVSSSPLDTGFHTYGMELVAGKSVKFYLDGKFVTEQPIGITTEPWEIIIWNAFATSNTSGYHTVGNPSTLAPSTLKVAEVQVYS
jgi:beta-glucanase (GH16 family)